MSKEFYRYEVIDITTYWDYPYTQYILRLYTYYPVKETPKGYWISPVDHEYIRKWISKEDTRKKYARETKERALGDFVERMKYRLGHLRRAVRKTQKGLELARKLIESMKSEERRLQ